MFRTFKRFEKFDADGRRDNSESLHDLVKTRKYKKHQMLFTFVLRYKNAFSNVGFNLEKI